MVTLSNPLSTTLSITSIGINPAGGPFAIQSNSCGSSLAAGANCTINVTFTPTTTGTQNATLSVTDNAATSPQTASLTGTGASSTGGVVYLATKAYGAYSNSSIAQSTIASGAFAVPAGDLIVAYCGVGTSTVDTVSISDGAGNVFRQVGTTVSASHGTALAMYYSSNAKGSSADSVTCTWGAAHHNLAVMVLVYSGADPTSPLDASASGSDSGSSSTTLQTSAFSTTSASDVIVAGMMFGTGCNPPPPPGSGYTIEVNAIPGGCGGPLAAAEDRIVSTLQTNITASMTVPLATYADMIAATFKAAP